VPSSSTKKRSHRGRSNAKSKKKLSSSLKVYTVCGECEVTLGGTTTTIVPYALNTTSNYVQAVLHIEQNNTNRNKEWVEGRLFISPWLAFRGSFPMRGSYFVQNEMFQLEGLCRAKRSSLRTDEPSEIHLARSMPAIFRPDLSRPTAEVAQIFTKGYVCCRRFRFPRQLRSYGKHLESVKKPLTSGEQEKQDIREVVHRLVHILANQKKEQDWKEQRERGGTQQKLRPSIQPYSGLRFSCL
jgi:hypothetical protein